MPELKDVLQATPLIAFFLILAYVLRKGLPAWEKIRLAEISVQHDELAVREAEAQAVNSLSLSVSQLTGIFSKVDETTKELKLFLRAAMRQNEAIEERMVVLEQRVDEIQGGRRH